MDELHADLSDKYNELAPGIEKYKDKKGADNLYKELLAIAKQHGAEREFSRMCNGARNRAHMDYDTNPGGFENWFWYLGLGNEKGVEEGFNGGGEYNDEVGMIKNDLRTIVRCTENLEKILEENENIAEWVQEKIAVSKSMMVTILDYVKSEHELGHVYSMNENINEWKKSTKAPVRPRNFVAKNATTGGAGAHKDKKKDAKQGKTKHKKPAEVDEHYANSLSRTLEVIETYGKRWDSKRQIWK
jgi:hypothetical protein